MLLITGVVAAAILIVAVLPVVWSMVGTFSSASASTDTRMRTDFKIVTTYARYISGTGYAGATVTVWMKNVGSSRIGYTDLNSADVYLGKSDNFGRATINVPNWSIVARTSTTAIPWNFSLRDPYPSNGIWEPGETLEVNAFYPSTSSLSGQSMYFQLTLPNSVSRSAEFAAI
jgi:flagellar protein FlaG